MSYPIDLYVDSISLIYHEARNVRHLVKKGYLPKVGLEKIISLPRNRVEAWREVQPSRKEAHDLNTVEGANKVFFERFGINLQELLKIYQNKNWEHAKEYGGNAWAEVTELMLFLGRTLRSQDTKQIEEACDRLGQACHNNGKLLDKLNSLDKQL